MQPLPSSIGRYQIRERLGQGGMGLLFLAHDPTIDRLVALKVLRFDEAPLRERFLREARLVARLQHPNIITIYEIGSHARQPFIAMEYVDGDTLDAVVARRLRLPLLRKLELMIELCDALAYAHGTGVVHRDIKPSNLIVHRESGRLKVLDFGIARTPDSSLTQVGSIVGTPNYMSPEQVEGRSLDRRSDVFAAGAVLFELLAHRQAFSGETPFHVLQQIVQHTPEPLSRIDPGLDPGLQTVLDRTLAKNPAHRYADLEAMRRDLLAIVKRHQARAQDQTLIVSMPAPPRPATPRTFDLSKVLEHRSARINEQLAVADAALAEGYPDRSLAAAEQAAVIDPVDPRVLAALERARAALDARDVADWLAAAREEFGRGAVTEARRFVALALQVAPDDEAALHLYDEVQREGEDRERARERTRNAERALAHAELAFGSGDLDGAWRAAIEAHAYDPDSSAVIQMRDRVDQAIARRAEGSSEDPREEDQASRLAIALARFGSSGSAAPLAAGASGVNPAHVGAAHVGAGHFNAGSPAGVSPASWGTLVTAEIREQQEQRARDLGSSVHAANDARHQNVDHEGAEHEIVCPTCASRVTLSRGLPPVAVASTPAPRPAPVPAPATAAARERTGVRHPLSLWRLTRLNRSRRRRRRSPLAAPASLVERSSRLARVGLARVVRVAGRSVAHLGLGLLIAWLVLLMLGVSTLWRETTRHRGLPVIGPSLMGSSSLARPTFSQAIDRAAAVSAPLDSHRPRARRNP